MKELVSDYTVLSLENLEVDDVWLLIQKVIILSETCFITTHEDVSRLEQSAPNLSKLTKDELLIVAKVAFDTYSTMIEIMDKTFLEVKDKCIVRIEEINVLIGKLIDMGVPYELMPDLAQALPEIDIHNVSGVHAFYKDLLELISELETSRVIVSLKAIHTKSKPKTKPKIVDGGLKVLPFKPKT